jgi:HEAT repeat protein
MAEPSLKEVVEAMLREIISRASLQDIPPEVLRAELKNKFSGDPRSVEILLAIARDKESTERIPALVALEELGNAEAVPELISILRDHDNIFITRQSAAEALGGIGDSRAIEALSEAMADKTVGREAAEALAKIQNPQAVETLLQSVAHEGSNYEARRALMSISGQHALEPLLTGLSHSDSEVRELVVECLGCFKHQAVFSALAKALEDTEISVKVAAAKALGALKEHSAVEHLIAALNDDAPEVKMSVQTALENITGKTFLFGGSSAEKWNKWWLANKDRMVR